MFWTRDLGFSTPSLVRLGEGARVRASLAYARRVDARRSHVTTTINYGERPADVFEYGVDSLPLLLAALRASDADDLLERHRDWLGAEVAWFARRVVDPGPASSGRTAPTARTATPSSTEHRLRQHDGRAAREDPRRDALAAVTVRAPLRGRLRPAPARTLLGRRSFRDALGDHTVSGEANVWPFYAGVVGDDRLLASALRFLAATGFCDPYPLRYETIRRPGREVWFTRHVLPDYQGTTVWTSLGAIYLQLLRNVDPASARNEIDRYRVDRARRHVLGSSTTAAGRGSARGACSSAKIHALVGDLPRRPGARRRGSAEPECPRRRIGFGAMAKRRRGSTAHGRSRHAGRRQALVQKLADDLGIGIVVGNVEDGPPCRITALLNFGIVQTEVTVEGRTRPAWRELARAAAAWRQSNR